jgi:hypothetical protein
VTTLTLEPQKAIFFWAMMGLLFFVLLFGGCAMLVYSQHKAVAVSEAADTKDAPLQTATAVVESKRPWGGNTKNPIYAGYVLNAHIDGRAAFTPAVLDERTYGVRIGDSIQVKYRVGKSGKIYIEGWQPAPH